MRRHSTARLVGFVAVTTLVAGILPLAIGRDPSSDPDPSARGPATAAPVTGDALERRVEGTVRERGVLESAAAVTLVSEVPGPNTIVRLVAEGTRVEKGDVLVVLDSSAIEDQRSEQRIVVGRAAAAVEATSARLAAARSQLDLDVEAADLSVQLAALRRRDVLGKDGEYDASVQVAEARLEAVNLQRELAQAAFDRARSAGRNAEPTALLQSRAALAESEALFAEVSQRLASLKTGREREEVAQDLAIVTARADAARVKSTARADLAAAEALVEESRSGLQLESERLAKLDRQLAACTITALQDGIVIHASARTARRAAADDSVEEGAVVRERQALVSVVDPSKLQVRVSVHESRIARVQPGQPVTLRFDAFPERSWSGRVAEVSSIPAPGNWLQPDVRHYDVVVSVDEPTPELRVGMSAVAEIAAE